MYGQSSGDVQAESSRWRVPLLLRVTDRLAYTRQNSFVSPGSVASTVGKAVVVSLTLLFHTTGMRKGKSAANFSVGVEIAV